MIQFERKTCDDLEAALRREWLETNGLGGFASSTIIGLNTRRYHGLLVAATKPVGRLVLLSTPAYANYLSCDLGFRVKSLPWTRGCLPSFCPTTLGFVRIRHIPLRSIGGRDAGWCAVGRC
jgi:hypothetical protein